MKLTFWWLQTGKKKATNTGVGKFQILINIIKRMKWTHLTE